MLLTLITRLVSIETKETRSSSFRLQMMMEKLLFFFFHPHHHLILWCIGMSFGSLTHLLYYWRVCLSTTWTQFHCWLSTNFIIIFLPRFISLKQYWQRILWPFWQYFTKHQTVLLTLFGQFWLSVYQFLTNFDNILTSLTLLMNHNVFWMPLTKGEWLYNGQGRKHLKSITPCSLYQHKISQNGPTQTNLCKH